MVESLKEVLMQRDNMTAAEADQVISEAKQSVVNGANPEEILYDDFGLEPDYIFDLI